MSSNHLGLVQPLSKKDQVVALIRQAIIGGQLTAGDPIVESRIGSQIGAGTSLVREALIELEHQGFVRKIPYKGTYVTKLSHADVEGIFRLRRELETLAVEWAIERVTPADLDELRRLIERMRSAASELDLRQFYEYDLAFHRQLWQMSGNAWLVEALERLVPPLFAFFLIKTPRNQEHYLASVAEHAAIIETLRSGDTDAVRALMRSSVGVWRDDMLGTLFPAR